MTGSIQSMKWMLIAWQSSAWKTWNVHYALSAWLLQRERESRMWLEYLLLFLQMCAQEKGSEVLQGRRCGNKVCSCSETFQNICMCCCYLPFLSPCIYIPQDNVEDDVECSLKAGWIGRIVAVKRQNSSLTSLDVSCFWTSVSSRRQFPSHQPQQTRSRCGPVSFQRIHDFCQKPCCKDTKRKGSALPIQDSEFEAEPRVHSSCFFPTHPGVGGSTASLRSPCLCFSSFATIKRYLHSNITQPIHTP